MGKQGIENKTLNDLFTLNTKKHKMKTRTEEKYKVTHANKKRLQNSSIIYMQHLLNKAENNEKIYN